MDGMKPIALLLCLLLPSCGWRSGPKASDGLPVWTQAHAAKEGSCHR